MSIKRIFKRGKHKPSASEDHPAPSTDTPTGTRSSSPSPGSARGVWDLVTQPLLLMSSPNLPSRQQKNDWPSLEALSTFLNQTGVFSPLAEVINNLRWFVQLHENVCTGKTEYSTVRIQLESLCAELRSQLDKGIPPSITTSMQNLCRAVQVELMEVYGTMDKGTISRYLQSNLDTDKVTRCYRCIHGHLGRVMLNANLDTLRVVDRQAAESQLKGLNPSMAACYDSAEASVVQRRECAPQTRKQVLMDLKAWKDSKDAEKVCWINGMAGTGKTTIATTFCSILRESHELGASFFCTRSLPDCRNVKLIFPTIAYQLARFSLPFRIALLQVLEQDPDVHTKLPRVQLQRMILQPLHSVADSLPANIVVVIDALDECEDGSESGFL
ncbi:hypothetical protein RSOLAG1IB_12480 [Rhizoctonia solani AG-1 IB]|uniref:NACHT domain-containing protein n=1 Tax=Thanatephorus cucumeris (strain AG1-IB / isolate 7/3/14) TaxID=1108050 RepID=A0A0B7FUI3_THACB|nr:hypothetical protein RSOLAG1IB_12480 [Rhizoctonia solani AG-1 IB]